MSFKKGRKKSGGRSKGTPNKITKDVKEMVLEALESLGGTEWFIQQGKENPVAFMAMAGKAMPKETKIELLKTVKISMIGLEPDKKVPKVVQGEVINEAIS
jgi:hypothetical protein